MSTWFWVNGILRKGCPVDARWSQQTDTWCEHHGFRTSVFAADNCCNERDFMAGNSNADKSPAFPTLAHETAAEVVMNPLEASAREEQFTQKKNGAAPQISFDLLQKTRPEKSSMALS